MFSNRVKFMLAGPVLEFYNPKIAGRPHERVAERIGAADRRIVEVCAGSGYLSRLVAARWSDCEIDALDISAESVAYGRKRAAKADMDNIRFTHASAARMPFSDNTFDAAISCYGLHEIPSADRTHTYTELARVVRPGGRLIVADWDAPERGRRSVELVIRMVEKPHALEVLGDGIVDALCDVGFSILAHDRAQSRKLSFQLVEAVRKSY
ncbi:class I SAM-dependent methyltransferase [Mycobacterium paragordonae]|nr:class I SAM-dependent methyltransferase [Mycobacterium paragordonae]